MKSSVGSGTAWVKERDKLTSNNEACVASDTHVLTAAQAGRAGATAVANPADAGALADLEALHTVAHSLNDANHLEGSRWDKVDIMRQ